MGLVLRLVVFIGAVAVVFPARAVLVDLGDVIFDVDRRIMWTQSASLPGSQLLTWEEAKEWADNLVFAGFDDWRLPSALNRGGTGPCGPGFDCSRSEMGHLFYVELDCTGGVNEVSACVGNQGPFTDIQENRYWTGTPLLDVAAWEFSFWNGSQGFEVFGGTDDLLSAWAVRSVRLPESGTLALLFLGLLALALGRAKVRKTATAITSYKEPSVYGSRGRYHGFAAK